MDRVFAYEDAKKLCATHKQILNTIKKIIASRGKDASRVQKAAQEVYDSKVIASQIATALQSGNLNVAEQPNEKALLREVYVCHEGDKIVSLLESEGQLQKEVLGDIHSLEGVGSSLKWLFAGKQAKETANAAYQRLSKLLTGDYPAVVKAAESASKELDDITVTKAFGLVSGNEHQYYQTLLRNVPDMGRNSNLMPVIAQKIKQVNDTAAQYQSAKTNQRQKELMAKAAADQAINPLIMERTLMEMRNQDIEALTQRRAGIRIKALRDHGYRNMADLYAASQYQLASVYGISADAAKVIKAATNEIAQEVAKTIKLKISSDERTPAATALLKAAYKYDRVRKAGKFITPDIQKKSMMQ